MNGASAGEGEAVADNDIRGTAQASVRSSDSSTARIDQAQLKRCSDCPAIRGLHWNLTELAKRTRLDDRLGCSRFPSVLALAKKLLR